MLTSTSTSISLQLSWLASWIFLLRFAIGYGSYALSLQLGSFSQSIAEMHITLATLVVFLCPGLSSILWSTNTISIPNSREPTRMTKIREPSLSRSPEPAAKCTSKPTIFSGQTMHSSSGHLTVSYEPSRE